MQYIDSINNSKQVSIHPSFPKRKIRILHVVGGMNRGGIETWLMHVLRQLDRDRFQMDFMVHVAHPCAYDDEIRQLGSQIIPCLSPAHPLRYATNFHRLLREQGSYDIIHSHVHHFSGYVLKLAQAGAVPVRIAHSHTDISGLPSQTWRRSLYFKLMKAWIKRYATIGFGVSQPAAASLFGEAWRTDPRWQILAGGIDLTPFRSSDRGSTIRAELNLPADAFIVGHVGRFVEPKNHDFILEIAAQITQHEPKLYLLLVGDGPLRPLIEQKVEERSLKERVIFTGSRPDIPQLMHAMDVFLFPSFYEGLGLALVEAQAAGLPCVISDVIPQEADVVKPLIQRLSLTQPASQWAEAVLTQRCIQLQKLHSLSLVENSSFNITTSAEKLAAIYVNSFNEHQIKTGKLLTKS
jgi:glycosyltransferase involved in cell wall biosynthesis